MIETVEATMIERPEWPAINVTSEGKYLQMPGVIVPAWRAVSQIVGEQGIVVPTERSLDILETLVLMGWKPPEIGGCEES